MADQPQSSEGDFDSSCEIIAAVVSYAGELALLRRSPLVTGDVGRWNCITGFLESQIEPLAQAMLEIEEEAGISHGQLILKSQAMLTLKGSTDGRLWRIHVFHFDSTTRALKLNWENDASIWLMPDELNSVPTVSWFGEILNACGLQRPIPHAACS